MSTCHFAAYTTPLPRHHPIQTRSSNNHPQTATLPVPAMHHLLPPPPPVTHRLPPPHIAAQPGQDTPHGTHVRTHASHSALLMHPVTSCLPITTTTHSTALAATPPSGPLAMLRTPQLHICWLTAAPSAVAPPYVEASMIRWRHAGRCQGRRAAACSPGGVHPVRCGGVGAHLCQCCTWWRRQGRRLIAGQLLLSVAIRG